MLFIEGELDVGKRQSYSDKMIYEFIDPRFYQLDLIPKGGKQQVLNTLSATASFLASTPYMTRCFAMIDRDADSEPNIDGRVFRLPVCMIENLLISSAVLRSGFGVLQDRSDLCSDGLMNAAIIQVFKDLHDEEVARRFRRKIRMATFGPDRSIRDVETAEQYREAFVQSISQLDFSLAWQSASDEVSAIESECTQASFFSGKDFFKLFIARHVEPFGLTKPIYIYQCAKYIGENKLYSTYFDRLFTSVIGVSVPAPIGEIIAE